MSTQQPAHGLEEGIRLRAYVEVIVKYKWLVLASVAVAVALATVVNLFVLSPTYVSSVVVELPGADGSGGLGLTTQGYREFAISGPVVDAVLQQVGSNPGSSAASGKLSLLTEPDSGLVTVTASAQTADAAVELVTDWVGVFGQQTLALLEAQMDVKIAVAEVALDELLARLTDSEDALAKFDRVSPLSLFEPQLLTIGDDFVTIGSRLATFENDLIAREQRLRELTLFSIPTDETRLEILEAALESEPKTLDDQSGVVVLPGGNGSGAGVTSSEVTILNPVYLQLSEQLVLTRIRVGTNRREAEILQSQIVSLREEAVRLRDSSVTAKTERDRLQRNLNEALTLYRPAKSELDRLLNTQRLLPQMANPEVVNEARRPDAPVTPRKLINIATSGILAGMVGVILALILSWYRDERSAEVSRPATG